MKRILPVLLCLFIFAFTAFPASAAETGSITVEFRHETEPVAEASFEIYKAAEWNGSKYSLIAPFNGYPVNLSDNPSSEEWKAAASTLSAYAARDNLTPLATAKTDADGRLKFENLSEGLYLLLGTPTKRDDTMFLPQPMLVSVPYKTKDGNDYDVVTEPKYDTEKITGEKISRRALKVWKDKGNENKRPQEVTVQLLCDGKIYDEQILNAKNNWSYTWENLDSAHAWQLTEKEIPKDYTVKVTQEGITFTVTNTNNNPPPPPPSEPKLPQTGLLWWPVPVLAGIGAVSLFLGIFLLLFKKGEPHE